MPEPSGPGTHTPLIAFLMLYSKSKTLLVKDIILYLPHYVNIYSSAYTNHPPNYAMSLRHMIEDAFSYLREYNEIVSKKVEKK